MINKFKKNKKGIAPLFIGVIVIVGIALILGVGVGSAFQKIPAPVWIILAIVMMFSLFGGKKKK